jgi:hypothetical protein
MVFILMLGLLFAALRNRDNNWSVVYILAIAVLGATDRWWVPWIRSTRDKRRPAGEDERPNL